MKIRKFDIVAGNYVDSIVGQLKFGYSISDTVDFYELANEPKDSNFKGSTITFYDFSSGKTYEPFERVPNVIYGKPVYLKDYFWFLQGDFNERKFKLIKYLPGKEIEFVIELDMDDVNPYNLSIIGDDVHIISQDDEFVCYYPEKFRFTIDPNEGVSMISDGKVYLSAWIEEGWDDENNCQTDEYRYYEKIVVKDFEGNFLYEMVGSLQQHIDGSWWIG